MRTNSRLGTRPTYYESWLAAFEKLLDAKTILAQSAVNRRVRQIKQGSLPAPYPPAVWHSALAG